MNEGAARAALFSFDARQSAVRLSLLLAVLLAAAPFLLPEHRPPILSFYDEWLGVALGTAALLALTVHLGRTEVPVPALSAWFAALAAWLPLSAVLHPPAYWQLPLAGAVYLSFAGALAWLGHALARHCGAQRVADLLATAIAASAAVNAMIGLLQFYGIPEALSFLVARTYGPRIVGHVGQANLFADYLALGQASVLYLVARGRFRGAPAWIAAGLMAVASSYTQSRGAIVFALWIAGVWFLLRRHGPEWRTGFRAASALLCATVIAMFLVPRVHEALGWQPALSGLDRLLDRELIRTEPRLEAWPLAARLFLESPLLGVGWGEFAGASFFHGLPAGLASYPVVWTSPHNVALQLLAESGAVGALLALAAASFWWRRLAFRLRTAPALEDAWIAASMGVLCLHALLEYPLSYAHVLGLAALLAGLAAAPSFHLPARAAMAALFAAIAGLAFLCTWSFVDYQRFSKAYVTATGATLAQPAEVAEAAAVLHDVGRGPLGAEAAPWIYRSLPVESRTAPERLEAGERALRRFPAPSLVARYATMLELAGDNPKALQILHLAAGSRTAVCRELRNLPSTRAGLEFCSG